MLRDIAKLKARAAQLLRAGKREDAATLGATIEKTSALVRDRIKAAREVVKAEAATHAERTAASESKARMREAEREFASREQQAAVSALEKRLESAAAAAKAAEEHYAALLRKEHASNSAAMNELEVSFQEQLRRAMQESEALKRLEVSAAEERIARRLEAEHRDAANGRDLELARLRAKCESLEEAQTQAQNHVALVEAELAKMHEREEMATSVESAARAQLAVREAEARDAQNLMREETERMRSELAGVHAPLGEMRGIARDIHAKLQVFGAECGIGLSTGKAALLDMLEERENEPGEDPGDVGEGTARILKAVADAVGTALRQATDTLKQATAQRAELTAQLNATTQRAEALEEAREQAESRIAAAKARATRSETEVQGLRESAAAARAEWSSKLEAQEASASGAESRSRVEVANLRRDLEIAKDDLARAISARDAASSSASESVATAARERQELLSKVRRAEAEAMAATEKVADAEARHAKSLATAKAEASAARADVQRANAEAESAARELVNKDAQMQEHVAHYGGHGQAQLLGAFAQFLVQVFGDASLQHPVLGFAARARSPFFCLGHAVLR